MSELDFVDVSRKVAAALEARQHLGFIVGLSVQRESFSHVQEIRNWRYGLGDRRA